MALSGHGANAANSANETARIGPLGLNNLPGSLRNGPFLTVQLEYADQVLRVGVGNAGLSAALARPTR